MIETGTVGSPGWWLKRLHAKLIAQSQRCDVLDTYYRGENVIPNSATRAVRDAYRRLMEICRTNYAELIVEAVRERMTPVAFMTGAAGDENGDAEAWRIWQSNDLDADALLVHRNSLAMGDGFVIVGPVEPEIGVPLITVEDPREVCIAVDPRFKRKTIAALKLWLDDVEGAWRAYLYLPDGIHRAVGSMAATLNSETRSAPFTDTQWDWEGDVITLGDDVTNVVPVVRFANRMDTFGRSMGEFESHLSLLDRINYGVLNRLEIATLQAFKQRAIKGVESTDENGEPVDYTDIFQSAPDSLWILPETAEIWESGQVDLTPLKEAVKDDIKDLAAVTRTPLFYLTPEATSGSAEGASLAREGLIFKTGDRIVQASESWERVMALAFLIMGDTKRASQRDMQVKWAPPERFSLAERFDAAVKAQAAGLPWRQIMDSVLQFGPTDIARMEAEKMGDLLVASAGNGPAEAAGPSPLEELNQRVEMWGAMVRAGATPESAARVAGLEGLDFLPATPVTLKMMDGTMSTANAVGGNGSLGG